MKSFKRLGIDPLVVYGTLCVKCPIAEPASPPSSCLRRLVEEIAIVQPKIVVVMGEPALSSSTTLQVPLSRPVEPREGRSRRSPRRSTPSTRPTSTTSLDAEGAKRDFWRAFRTLGEWYEDLPPY